MTGVSLYLGASVTLFVLAAVAALTRADLIQRLIALNVMGTSVFLLLVTIAYRGADPHPDPVPQAMVLTGIVVAVSVTAFAVGLARRLAADEANASDEESETQ